MYIYMLPFFFGECVLVTAAAKLPESGQYEYVNLSLVCNMFILTKINA